MLSIFAINAITACVLGGVSFIGGEGDIDGVVMNLALIKNKLKLKKNVVNNVGVGKTA